MCIRDSYVGANSQPTFPVTASYARSVLFIYKPWRGDEMNKKTGWIPLFETFVNSSQCPPSVRIPYERVMSRYIDKTTHNETIAKESHQESEISKENQDFMDLTSLHHPSDPNTGELDITDIDVGKDYNWSQKHVMVSPEGNTNKCWYS